MLCALTIENILLIKRVELEFKAGLNTLTGETGVGKSVLLDCLGFVLGWKNNKELVRNGEEKGEVTAEFIIDNGSELFKILENYDITLKDNLILRRTINRRDNRKRNFLNDKIISLDFLKQVAKHLVELQGQNDSQTLMSEQNHIVCLDDFAGLQSKLKELQTLWKAKNDLQKHLNDEIENTQQLKRDREYLEFSAGEISRLNVQVNEEQDLLERRKHIKALVKNKEKFDKIEKLLTEHNFEGHLIETINLLGTFRSSLGEIIERPINSLERALDEFSDAHATISGITDFQLSDGSEIEQIENRLYDMRSLSRKHNVEVGLLPLLLEDINKKLANVKESNEKIRIIQNKIEEKKDLYEKKAKEVSKIRASAAKVLDEKVVFELKYLKMADCLFKTEVSAGKFGAKGMDSVVFKVKTNRGGVMDTLNKISSGGEMSRFLLALKVCLTKKNQGITMIFDEIDRGIGGATADAVGRRLKNLANLTQVIVVTHSPQVAAHGSHQWKVEKSTSKNTETTTYISELNAAERLSEIARMISGQEISNEARAAAKKLLG